MQGSPLPPSSAVLGVVAGLGLAFIGRAQELNSAEAAAAVRAWVDEGRLEQPFDELAASPASSLNVTLEALKPSHRLASTTAGQPPDFTDRGRALRAAQLLWQRLEQEPVEVARLVHGSARMWQAHTSDLHVELLLEIQVNAPQVLGGLDWQLPEFRVVPVEEGKPTQIGQGPIVTLKTRDGHVRSIDLQGFFLGDPSDVLGQSFSRPLSRLQIRPLETSRPTLVQLMEEAESPDPCLRERAARQLGAHGERGLNLLRALLQGERNKPWKQQWWFDDGTVLCFSDGKDEAVQRTVERELFRLAPEDELIEPALPRLAQSCVDRELRLRAIQQLGLSRLETDPATEALIACLKDLDRGVARAALNAAAVHPVQSDQIEKYVRFLSTADEADLAAHARRVLEVVQRNR